jgi:hypothetical protein
MSHIGKGSSEALVMRFGIVATATPLPPEPPSGEMLPPVQGGQQFLPNVPPDQGAQVQGGEDQGGQDQAPENDR